MYKYRVQVTHLNRFQVDIDSETPLTVGQIQTLAKENSEKEFGGCDDVEVGLIEMVIGDEPPKIEGKIHDEMAEAILFVKEAFDITIDQALDFVMKGCEAGLNENRDFPAMISVYVPEFVKHGFGPDETLTKMISALTGDVKATDKIADSIKGDFPWPDKVKDNDNTP